MDFFTKLRNSWQKNNTLLCIGLDPDNSKLPESIKTDLSPYFSFNKAIIDATSDLVCAYKPNSAFYEARGAVGIEELKKTCEYLQANFPELPIILDFKRGDIGSTANQYAKFAFEELKVDAVTVQPYLGQDSVQPFLEYKDKASFVLCRTSNPGAQEFQDLEVDGQKLYEVVAQRVQQDWNANNNCGLVVGANNPEELRAIRQIIGQDMIILLPGVGAQGADIGAALEAGLNQPKVGLIINSARDILYASSGEDFAEAARARATATRDEINRYR